VFQAQPNGVDYIVNATEPNFQHLLNPGVVQRRIVIVDGEYTIETVGIGVGNLGQLNTWPIFTDPVWGFAGAKLVIS
jgi:hypothetical protein